MPVHSARAFKPRGAADKPVPLPEMNVESLGEVRTASGDRECRCLMAGVELRASRDGKGPGMVVGYTAVFSKFSQDLGGFIEQIAPGAFSAALNQDVRALKNHDSNYLLGRNKSGTLRMVEDSLGLRVEIDLPDTQVGRDTATELARGDMDGMSFSFTTDVDQWDYSGKVPIRTLVKIRDLYDVGPVVYPAYTDTSAAMRSLDRNRPASPPHQAPPTSAGLHFDPLDSFRFRLKVEELRVLPMTPESLP